jgi:hypothetical protein
MVTAPALRFPDATPIAPTGMGGLLRDQFCNGRLSATVGWHGGLVEIGWWGRQHLSAGWFFRCSLETAWNKVFRACLGLGDQRHYLPLTDTSLYPFGFGGRSSVIGVDLDQELLLLPDALVQRFQVRRNPKRLPVFIEMFHQELIAAVNQGNRTWDRFTYDAELNAVVTSCTDRNPEVYRGDDALSQKGLGIEVRDAPEATTWIAIACDAPMRVRRSHNDFKLYLTSAPISGRAVALSLVFAPTRKALDERVRQLAASVHDECDGLVAGYRKRLAAQPAITVGDAVLDSAFAQYPEWIRAMEIGDRPGAFRGSATGYFVWGWDGMMPMGPCTWANQAGRTADVLRFFHQHCHPRIGLPLQFTTAFTPRLKEPFAAQAQYICGLYQYVAATGDLDLAREVLPTCRFILDRCRERVVRTADGVDTGLVAGNALWPDFPEAMDEDGDDANTLNNSLLYQGLRAMDYLARALGDAGLADECRAWAARLRASFVTYLFDQEHGYFLSSCSARDLSPRRHYPGQAIFWLTPFARELVAHAPGRIADFMDRHLRSARCLLTLPHWDQAWMADGNQLGSSYPAADHFYVNLHKLTGDAAGLRAWLGDVAWYWQHHTAPEAFTPEAENEDLFGPDNHGGKQLQAVSTWYTCLYHGAAGLDCDHEGLTVTPWGDLPVDIRGLKLRGAVIDLRIRGKGNHAVMTLNGKTLPAGSRKIPWAAFGKRARLEVARTAKAPAHPLIARADGLRVAAVATASGRLTATIQGDMAGEAAIQCAPGARITVDGAPFTGERDPATGCVNVPCVPGRDTVIAVEARAQRRAPAAKTPGAKKSVAKKPEAKAASAPKAPAAPRAAAAKAASARR